MTTEELGSRIRALRLARGLTPMHVARAAGVTREWLSRLERGRVPHPHAGTLARVAAALGLTLPDLLMQPPTATPPAQQPVRRAAPSAVIIEELVGELVNRGNLAVVDALLAPTFTIHGPLPDVTLERDGLLCALTALRRAVPDVTVRLDDLVAAADKLTASWTLIGTCRGTGSDVPPTGAAVVYTGMAFFRLTDGQVEETWVLAAAADRALQAARATLRNRLTPVVGYLQLLARRPRVLAGRSAAAVLEDEVLPRVRDLLDVIDRLYGPPPSPSRNTG